VRPHSLTHSHSLIYPTGRNQCNYAENKGVNSQAAARAKVIFNLLAQTASGVNINAMLAILVIPLLMHYLSYLCTASAAQRFLF